MMLISATVGDNYCTKVTETIPDGAVYAIAYAWKDMNCFTPYTEKREMKLR